MSACIVGVEPLRYTPAGIPALNLQLEHDAQLADSDQPRVVKLNIKAIAFGTTAERLSNQAFGVVVRFQGFLANAPKSKSVVFHIQDFLTE